MSATPGPSLNTCSSVSAFFPLRFLFGAFFRRSLIMSRAGSAPPQGGLALGAGSTLATTPPGLQFVAPPLFPGSTGSKGGAGQGLTTTRSVVPPPPSLEESSSVQTSKVTNSCPLHPLCPVGSHLPSIARHKVGAGGGFGPWHVATLSRGKACS